jgi:hypothetical protein
MIAMKHVVYNCVYFVWRSGEADPFTSRYDTYSGFTHSGWPPEGRLSHEGLVYSMGVYCILMDLKFFHIVYCDSNENRYSLVRERRMRKMPLTVMSVKD